MQLTTIGEILQAHATTARDDVFLFSPETDSELTFGELLQQTRLLCAKFDELGIAPGEKIAFLLDNGLWTTLLFLGVMASGRVVVPLNAVAGISQLEYVLGHCDAGLLFLGARFSDEMQPVAEAIDREIIVVPTDEDSGPQWQWPAQATKLPERDAHDAALLLYTSGTTGLPKGAVLSQRAVVAGGRNVAGGHALQSSDRALCVLPVYHINGAMVTVSAPLVSRGSVVMPRRFSAGEYWHLLEKYRCSWSSVVPTIVKYLLDRADQETFSFGDDERLSNFRFARSASAALPPIMLEQWQETFHTPMIETIGLTETAGTVMTNPMPPAPRKAGSVGRPFGCVAAIFDDSGNELDDEMTGEIAYRGDNVLTGYYKNPDETAAAFRDGWFLSGDLGYRDTDGYYYITGRSKELIIRGGENIAPREIDEVLYKHPALLEAAAVGVHDDNYGQEVVACVVLRDRQHLEEEELIDFCIRAVGRYKAPKRIYFMPDLPKGPSGKIQRLRLPDLIEALADAVN